MNYREALADSLCQAMADDDRVLCLGVGVADCKGIFGTTKEVAQRYPDRVVETPLSEHTLTGACVGLALEGYKPVLVHARADFLMLAMEHLVNTAAKWNASHGRTKPLPMVVRAIIGRGWGQGPQHSQNFASWLAAAPGLNILAPVTVKRAQYSIQDALVTGKPTVIFESRRLFETELDCPDAIEAESTDIILLTVGDIVLDALAAVPLLRQVGIEAAVRPVEALTAQWLRRDRLKPYIICDTGFGFVQSVADGSLVCPEFRPCPTAASQEAEWYPSVDDIVRAACLRFSKLPPAPAGKIPLDAFRGPF